MNLLSAIKKIFGNVFREPQVGDVYNMYSDSPFDPKPLLRIEITDVKDGWVEYKYVGIDTPKRESIRVSTLVRIYELDTGVDS